MKTFQKLSRFLLMLAFVIMTVPMLAQARVDDGKKTITDVSLTYDETAVFPTTRLTGLQVSTALFNAVTSPKQGEKLDPNVPWFVRGQKNSTDERTALYRVSMDSRGAWLNFINLAESTEMLKESETLGSYHTEYAYCFSIYANDGWEFDFNAFPTVSINGRAAEVTTFINAREIQIWQRAGLNDEEDSNYVSNFAITPCNFVAEQGEYFDHQLNISLDGTEYYDAQEDIRWRVVGATSRFTEIQELGCLVVGEDEEAEQLEIHGSIGGFEDIVYVPTTFAKIKFEKYYDYCHAYEGCDWWLNFILDQGVDFSDLKFEVYGNMSKDTKVADASYRNGVGEIYLHVSPEERSERIRLHVYSTKNPATVADYVLDLIYEEEWEYIDRMFVSYDKSQVPFNTEVSGRTVSEKLFEAVTCDKFGDSLIHDWYVYGDPYGSTMETGLWVRTAPVTDGSVPEWRNGFTSLANSDELLTAGKDYYFSFMLSKGDVNLLDTVDYQVFLNYAIPTLVRRDDYGNLIIFQKVELEVPVTFEITKQPKDWYGTYGKKAVFTVEATGNGLSYQWQYKKSGNWIDYGITTADTPTFKVTMNEKNVKWPIRCRITDGNGEELFTKEVRMKDASTSAPIVITKQPVDWIGVYGKKATFSIEATGNGLTYQWQYKKGGSWIDYAVSTADSAVFKVTMNEKNVKWPIRCLVTDEDGNKQPSNEVWMKLKSEEPVPAGIVITTQPVDWVGTYGKKARFSVVATGNGLTYQWQYKKGSGDWTDYNIATADTADFSVTMNEKNVKWTYRCFITDANGDTATTNEVHMKLKEEPAPAGITIVTQPSDWYGRIGKKASFSVVATGNGLTYQWQYKKGSGDWTNYDIATADTANFQVTMNEKNVKWTYRCLITDADGNVLPTNEVHLYVQQDS